MKKKSIDRQHQNEELARQIHLRILEKLNDSKADGYSNTVRQRGQEGRLLAHNDRTTNIPITEINRLYLPELMIIEDCMGPELSVSHHDGDLNQPSVVHHRELSLYVALRAIESLNTNPKWWLLWSGQQDDTVKHEEWRRAWMLALFRCTLSMPIGYLVSHTALQSTGSNPRSWQPCAENLPSFSSVHGPVRVTKSNRRVAPRMVSFSTYLRIFERSPIDVPMLSIAEADFFSDRPNSDNPLYKAFDYAMKHVFYDRFYLRLPYWWVLVLNHHFVRHEGYTPIECVIRRGYGLPWNENTAGAKPEAQTAPVVTQQDPWSATQAGPGKQIPSPAPMLQIDPIEPIVTAQDIPSSRLLDKAPAKESNTPLNPLVAASLEIVRDRIASGVFTANCQGAVFHGVEGQTLLVVPLFWKILATHLNKPGVLPENLSQAYVEAGFILKPPGCALERDFAIYPSGVTKRVGKVRGVTLSIDGRDSLFPDGVPFGDNTDLRPLMPKPTENVA